MENFFIVLWYSFWHLFCDTVDLLALELNPDYLKALMRRAQSCEALEKYEDALEGKQDSQLFFWSKWSGWNQPSYLLLAPKGWDWKWPLVINEW